MKRIANDVAVVTICYTISGTQKIRIVDYESDYAPLTGNGETVCEGKLNDVMYGRPYSKYFESKCRGLRVDGDTIVFDVFTRFEEYK